jgi:hypothetical protein
MANSSLTCVVPTEFLTLESNELDGFIPSELGMLENLDVLAVHQNHLKGNMPDEICSVANTTNFVVTADCSEVQCECCTLCCMECKGDDSGVLLQNTQPEPPVPTAPSPAPTGMFDALKPAIADLKQVVPTASAQENLWPFLVSVGGLTDVPSDAPSFVPSDAPSPDPTECVAINVEESCFEFNGGNLVAEFRNCEATASDWIGLFEDEKDFTDTESSLLGASAPPTDDAESWLRACGNRQCSVATNSGTVEFGNGKLQMKEGDYRVILVQQGVTKATSQVFEVRRRC